MKITIQKYDPAVDAEPYAIEGEVPWKEKMTALEALVYFHENIEPVNFDYNCACRLCGRCAMMIDGEACLACVTPIEDADHTYAPLAGYPVIRDLIVDKEALDQQMSGIFARKRIEPYTEETLVVPFASEEERTQAYAMEFCCRCGACTANCPAVAAFPNDYAGPAAMAAIAYRFYDPLDQGDRVMEAVSAGLYRCIMCGKCDETCAQQDIDHLGAWTKLREAAEARGLRPSYADEVEAMAPSILAAALGAGEAPDCASCHDDGRKAGDANPHGY